MCGALQRTAGAPAAAPSARADLSVPEIVWAGGLAGCIAWTLVVPADTVCSQMQATVGRGPRPSMIAVATRIYREAGLFHGLFRGWTAIMLRAFPANAATFLGFELARRHIPAWV